MSRSTIIMFMIMSLWLFIGSSIDAHRYNQLKKDYTSQVKLVKDLQEQTVELTDLLKNVQNGVLANQKEILTQAKLSHETDKKLAELVLGRRLR